MLGTEDSTAPPDRPHLGQLKDLPSQLIFIMGCHRSGTSMLYHLLAYTGQLDYISAYNIIKYDELLHNRITGREEQVKANLQQVLQQETTRGLDDLPVGTDLPEEYRFLMRQDGPRMVFNFKKRLDQLFFAPHLTPRTLDEFVRMCQKKRFLAGEDRPLVLKNPADYYFNFWAVHQMLPEAKFIFIHRHPLSMFNSYLHGFPGLLKQRSNYAAMLDKRYDALFAGLPFRRQLFLAVFRSNMMYRLLLTRLVESFSYYVAHVPKLPPEQYVSVRYEDVCADPVRSLSQIGERLHLGLVPRVPPKFVAPRHIPVPERVKKHYAHRVDEMAPYLQYCEYTAWQD
jgi:hypothetical protein